MSSNTRVNHSQADAVQWAIDELKQLNPLKGLEGQEEHQHMHQLKLLRDQLQGPDYRAYRRPT